MLVIAEEGRKIFTSMEKSELVATTPCGSTAMAASTQRSMMVRRH